MSLSQFSANDIDSLESIDMKIPLIEKHRNDLDKKISITEENLRRSILFVWFSKLLKKASKNNINMTDLPNLPHTMQSQYTYTEYRNLAQNLKKQRESSKVTLNQKNNNTDLWNLFINLYNHHSIPFFVTGVIKFLIICCGFIGPLLLSCLVDFIETSTNEKSAKMSKKRLLYGLFLVFCLTISFIATAILNSSFSIRSNIIQTKIQGSLTRHIFNHALSLPIYKWNQIEFTSAKLITFIQVDIDRLVGAVTGLHDLWALPIQLIATFILLYTQVHLAFLTGVFIIFLMIPINGFISHRIHTANTGLMQCKDDRVRMTNEAVAGMRAVKMLSLEEALSRFLHTSRAMEFGYLKHIKYLDAACVFLWAWMPVAVPAATLSVAVWLRKDTQPDLTAAEVFTTISLLGMLIFPMNAYPWVLNGLIEAKISASRIAALLAVAAPQPLLTTRRSIKRVRRVSFEDDRPAAGGTVATVTPLSVPQAADLLQLNATAWIYPNTSSTNKQTSSLAAANDSNRSIMTFPDFFLGPFSFKWSGGQLWGIIGPVGSGKTSFLMACLGEMQPYSGRMDYLEDPSGGGRRPSNSWYLQSPRSLESHPLAAYCPQLPPMHSGSVRENILMGSKMAEDLYRDILRGCQLLPDIQSWPQGDRTAVGEGGSRLSGGQRLRIGIARALYSQAKMIFIDDPFSALDGSCALLLRRYLEEVAIEQQRLVVVATHSVHLLEGHCTGCVYLEEGNVKEVKKGVWITDSIETEKQLEVSTDARGVADGGEVSGNAVQQLRPLYINEDEEAERTDNDTIAAGVYWTYLRAVGHLLLGAILLSTFLMQLTCNLLFVWIAYWVTHQAVYSNDQFVTITMSIAALSGVFTILRSVLFAIGGLRAASLLYARLTKAVLNTSIGFFESNSLGKIVNRFGKDTFCIDDQLPFMLNIVLAQVFLLLGSLVTIAYSDYLVIGVVLIVGVLYYKLQRYYRHTSRGLRRMDAVYKTPLMAILCDCAANGPVLRAQKALPFYDGQLRSALDDSLRVSLSAAVATQWLSLRLQLLGAALSSSLALSAVLSIYTGFATISAGLLGLSLSLSLNIVQNLNGLVGSSTQAETEMVSVERVNEYSQLPDEFAGSSYSKSNSKSKSKQTNRNIAATFSNNTSNIDALEFALLSNNDASDSDEEIDSGSVFRGATSSGAAPAVEFRDVCLSYAAHLPCVLQNVSFVIPPGSRVAVVGRTGSGKSSLFRAILRMTSYPPSGKVLLFGTSVRRLALKDLRKSVTAIPQDPFLFTGTIRLNVDPYQRSSDKDIYCVLERCGFIETLFCNPENNTMFHSMNISSRNQNAKSKSVSSVESLIQFDGSSYPLLDTTLQDGGSGLSQGQRQLLAIARAVLQCECEEVSSHNQQQRLVLIDEATAAVDEITEKLLVTAFSTMFGDQKSASQSLPTTVLMVCHKTAGIRSLCDWVLTMDDGKALSLERVRVSTAD